MRRKPFIYQKKAQTALEYILLLSIVVILVLFAFHRFLPQISGSSELFFNRTANGIMGRPNPCGDGTCASSESCEKCPADCYMFCP